MITKVNPDVKLEQNSEIIIHMFFNFLSNIFFKDHNIF